MSGNATSPPGVPLWKSSTRPSSGPVLSTSSCRPSAVARTRVTFDGSLTMQVTLIAASGQAAEVHRLHLGRLAVGDQQRGAVRDHRELPGLQARPDVAEQGW